MHKSLLDFLLIHVRYQNGIDQITQSALIFFGQFNQIFVELGRHSNRDPVLIVQDLPSRFPFFGVCAFGCHSILYQFSMFS